MAHQNYEADCICVCTHACVVGGYQVGRGSSYDPAIVILQLDPAIDTMGHHRSILALWAVLNGTTQQTEHGVPEAGTSTLISIACLQRQKCAIGW